MCDNESVGLSGLGWGSFRLGIRSFLVRLRKNQDWVVISSLALDFRLNPTLTQVYPKILGSSWVQPPKALSLLNLKVSNQVQVTGFTDTRNSFCLSSLTLSFEEEEKTSSKLSYLSSS